MYLPFLSPNYKHFLFGYITHFFKIDLKTCNILLAKWKISLKIHYLPTSHFSKKINLFAPCIACCRHEYSNYSTFSTCLCKCIHCIYPESWKCTPIIHYVITTKVPKTIWIGMYLFSLWNLFLFFFEKKVFSWNSK